MCPRAGSLKFGGLVFGGVSVKGNEVRLFFPHLGLFEIEPLPFYEVLELRSGWWTAPTLSDVDHVFDANAVVEVIKIVLSFWSLHRRGEVVAPRQRKYVKSLRGDLVVAHKL